MIKRTRALSIEQGGIVHRKGKNGKKRKLGTYCRYFQTQPGVFTKTWCEGFLWYPPCPDLELCKSKPRKRRKVVAAVREVEEETEVSVMGMSSSSSR